MPQIESDRARLVTESYMQTENLPIIKRRSAAFAHIMKNLPITIREGELIVGSNTKRPRSCQTFPEYSFEWLEKEFDTVATRSADPFYISEENKQVLREAHKYWKGKTNSDLATSFMAPEALKAIEHNIFTTGNYFYNGVGHLCVDYGKVLAIGYNGIKAEAQAALERCSRRTRIMHSVRAFSKRLSSAATQPFYMRTDMRSLPKAWRARQPANAGRNF